jgi:hypothetical protein
MKVDLTHHKGVGMSSLVIDKTSFVTGKKKVEIDIYELQIRLLSIVKESDPEVIKLAIHTMLDEIADGLK